MSLQVANQPMLGTGIGSLDSPPRSFTFAAPAGLPYGLGFWLSPETGAVRLEGMDAGVSFRSVHGPGATYTVISNTSDGAWPIARLLEARLGS